MRQATALSGNTFGATYWTDGAMYAPMLPHEEPVVRCPHCGGVCWIDDLEEVDSIQQFPGWLMYDDSHVQDGELWRKPGLYAGVPRHEQPSPEQMIAFANSGIAQEERELHVRVRAWQQFNNHRRKGSGPIHMSDAEAENVVRVARILEGMHDSQSRLLRAEALRELGRFEEARHAIKQSAFDKAESYLARFLLELIDAHDAQVRRLPNPEDVGA